MSDTPMPVECFPVGHYVREEMDARCWGIRDVALRMGWQTPEEFKLNHLTLEFVLAGLAEPNLVLGEDTAAKLSTAFGVPAELFLNLDRQYRDWLKAKVTP